jgi:hypothetical protein
MSAYPASRYGYYSFTTADNGKVLGFPLLQSVNGNPNNFTGAAATLNLRDQNGVLYMHTLVWNAATTEWEYAVVAGEFPAGRYWAMVAVTFPGQTGGSAAGTGSVGPIYSSEVIFDVVAAD